MEHLRPEQVETYALGRVLEEEEMRQIEEHYFACEECLDLLELEDATILAIREALSAKSQLPCTGIN